MTRIPARIGLAAFVLLSMSAIAAAQTLRATDYDGDGKSDLTTFRPSSGTSYVLKSSGGFSTDQIWIPGAISTDLAAPGDYDGDGKADAAYFRPSTGQWQIVKSSTNFTTTFTVTCGGSGDLPVPGDYDGDGKTDVAVFRPATGQWTIVRSSTGATTTTAWGMWTDIPVPGDYDGDGKTDVAVFHPSNGQWQILNSSTGAPTTVVWGSGAAHDIPVPGDYDGDGKTDLATFRPWDATHQATMWWVLESHANFTTQWSVAWGASTDVPVPGDYDGDGKIDLAVYRPSTATWYVDESHSSYTTQWTHAWGGATDLAGPNVVYANSQKIYAGPRVSEVTRAGDFDRDGRTDLTTYRPSTGAWYTRTSLSNYTAQIARGWGTSGDIPVPGDYDGDGKTDPAYYRPTSSEWHILTSSTNYTTNVTVSCGVAGDVPVPGDYDGDGKTDVAVFHPATGQWQIVNSRDGSTTTITHGTSTDIPVPADYENDGRVDAAVYRPSTGDWVIRVSSTGALATVRYGGASTDTPVPGDYDGDGQADLAVFRAWDPTQQKTLWWVLESHANFTTQWSREWGTSTDVPVPGDYDGDGKMDLAVYRPSTAQWLILNSSSNYTTSQTVSFGTTADVTVGRATRTLQPLIASVSPASGLVGQSVTITGVNFGASQGSSTVTFAGVAASPTSWSATSIVVPVPSAATTGDVFVTVTGVASNAALFVVTPSLASLSPTSGPTGTLVTIAGSHLGATQGIGTVTFNGTAASVVSWTDTTIAAMVPSTATTGSVVVNVGGVSTNAATFTVTDVDRTPPVVSITSPATNTTVSSATLAVTGTASDAQSNLQSVTCNGTTASFGGGNVSCTVTLVPGPNVIVLQATDTAGNVASASVTVTLQTAAVSIAVIPATRSLAVGDAESLDVLDNAGLTVGNAAWASGNTAVATVDSTGLVTALAAGQTTLTVTAGSLSAQGVVTVYPAGALPAGTTKWSIPPVNPSASGLLVGVSSVDTTSFAFVEGTANANVCIVRGFTADGRPTWSANVSGCGGPPFFQGQVSGDVDGGILLMGSNSVTRVDPLGTTSWRFSAPASVAAMAQAPDGTVFLNVNATWNNGLLTSPSTVVALDGSTGRQKFAIALPTGRMRNDLVQGSLNCSHPLRAWPSELRPPTIDANGLATILVGTATLDLCYGYNVPDPVPPQVDVSLYRISTSGAVSVVPLRHYEGTNRPFDTLFGMIPGINGSTLPDDQGGVAVFWQACYVTFYGCESLVGRHVSSGSTGAEYQVSAIPALSGSSQRAYINNSSANNSVSALDMKTGQLVWTSAPSTGWRYPTAVLDGGQVMVSDLHGGNLVLGPDGSTIATQAADPLGGFARMFAGDAQIGTANNGPASAASGVTTFLDLAAGYPLVGGSPANRNSAEKCTDNLQKEMLRQEYRYSIKVPSCRSFVNGFPVATPYYQFGPFGVQGSWLMDATYNWALVSPALITGVNTIMGVVRNGIPLTLTSGFRGPLKEWSLTSGGANPKPLYDSPHTEGIGADFHIPGINHQNEELSHPTWNALRDQAKDPAVAQAIRQYTGAAACVEPWDRMPVGLRHLHVDFRPCPAQW